MRVERLNRQAARIRGGLQHQRWHSANKNGLGGTGGAVTAEIARHLAAAGGVTDVNRLAKIERLDQREEIVRIRVHLVAAPRLARSSVATPIVSDAAIAA